MNFQGDCTQHLRDGVPKAWFANRWRAKATAGSLYLRRAVEAFDILPGGPNRAVERVHNSRPLLMAVRTRKAHPMSARTEGEMGPPIPAPKIWVLQAN